MFRSIFCLLIITAVFGCGQTHQTESDTKQTTDTSAGDSMAHLLHKITSIPMNHYPGQNDCGDPAFWKVVKTGKASIPLLIEQLNDSSDTQMQVGCYEKKLKINHLAFIVLNRICFFPISAETGMQFDVMEEGCPFALGFLQYMDKNRSAFQILVAKWYEKNQHSMRWQAYADSCRLRNGVSGSWTTSY